MAQFCKCGSIIINNACTNKQCAYKANTQAVKAAGAKAASAGKAPSKAAARSSTRKNSKITTYRIEDLPAEEKQ